LPKGGQRNELEKNIQFAKNQLDDILKNPGLRNFFSGRKGELEKQIIDYKKGFHY
jgi:hypothetical protein